MVATARVASVERAGAAAERKKPARPTAPPPGPYGVGRSWAVPVAPPAKEKNPRKRNGGCRSRESSREDEKEKRRKGVAGRQPTARATAPLADIRGAKLSLHDLQAVVVNLDRRPDRMESCALRLQEHCPWLRYTRFDASDGRRDVISAMEVGSAWHTGRNVVYQKQRSMRKGWDDLESYQERELELSSGERGCALSHVRAWRHCLENAGPAGQLPLLVLEDDAAPTPEFTARLAAVAVAMPADAHVLYLGYSQAADWRREVSPEIVESEYVWTTVGYIVWPAGARVMLSKLPVDQPVDNWMAELNASGALKSYCVKPKIVRQAEAWNVNSDVGHSDEQYWGPDSDIRHSDEFYWGTGDADALPGSNVRHSDEFYWGTDSICCVSDTEGA